MRIYDHFRHFPTKTQFWSLTPSQSAGMSSTQGIISQSQPVISLIYPFFCLGFLVSGCQWYRFVSGYSSYSWSADDSFDVHPSIRSRYLQYKSGRRRGNHCSVVMKFSKKRLMRTKSSCDKNNEPMVYEIEERLRVQLHRMRVKEQDVWKEGVVQVTTSLSILPMFRSFRLHHRTIEHSVWAKSTHNLNLSRQVVRWDFQTT